LNLEREGKKYRN